MTRKGRKRKAAKRAPSGQISREGAESPMQTALEARVRVLGVPPSLAMDQDAGTVLGRLYLTRDKHGNRLISEAEKLAGYAFERIHGRCASAIQTPIPLAKRDPGQVMDWDAMDLKARKEYTDRAIRAQVNWDAAMGWAMEAGKTPTAELLRVCIDHQEPYRLKTLRKGLAQLAKRMRITEAKAETAA